MIKKSFLIFDMDGTLVNSSITIANAINYVRQKLGFDSMKPEEILRYVNDHTINPAQLFYHAKTFDENHERWFAEYYTKNHKSELVLYEGIKVLLENLKKSGYKLAVATNAYRQSTLESLSHLDIIQFFDAIGCYDDVDAGKPAPDILYKVLDEVGCSVQESLFIGDGSRDEIAAKRANMDYIMVDWGFSDYGDAVRSIGQLEERLYR